MWKENIRFLHDFSPRKTDCRSGPGANETPMASSLLITVSKTKDKAMKPGDHLVLTTPVRSRISGKFMPLEGVFIRAVSNLPRKLILVDFGSERTEYVFPEEVLPR
jgi:hypothetical protein